MLNPYPPTEIWIGSDPRKATGGGFIHNIFNEMSYVQGFLKNYMRAVDRNIVTSPVVKIPLFLNFESGYPTPMFIYELSCSCREKYFGNTFRQLSQ